MLAGNRRVFLHILRLTVQGAYSLVLSLSSGPTCPRRAVKTSISEEKSALLFLSSRLLPELETELHLLHGSVARRPYLSFSFFLYYDIPDLGWTFEHGSIWAPSGVFSPLTLSSQD